MMNRPTPAEVVLWTCVTFLMPTGNMNEPQYSPVMLPADAGGAESERPCPTQCICKPMSRMSRVYCNHLNWTSLEHDLPHRVEKLDLSQNRLSRLTDENFIKYPHLEELNLSNNNLVNLTANVFYGLSRLRLLNIRGNNFTSIPWQSMEILSSLQELHMGDNQIHFISVHDFRELVGLKTLMLDKNLLGSIPREALQSLRKLQVLSLAGNNISRVDSASFPNLTTLEVLSLANNQISSIKVDAFSTLSALEILELQHNHLQSIPEAIRHLPMLRKLSVAFNHIHYVSDGIFAHNPFLAHADILGNPLTKIEPKVYTNLTHLKILIIPEAKDLTSFPDLNGTTSLEFLRIERAQIYQVPENLCRISLNLKTLDLKSNFLVNVPHLLDCTELRQLQLSGNQIRSLDGGLFRHQELLHDLLLGNNLIETISQDAFYGLHKLEILNLIGNRIRSIHHDSFLPLKQLVYLNLAENRFPKLPHHGLDHVRQLLAFDNPWLQDFPPPSSFPHVHTLRLSYAYHCCQFVPLASQKGNSANRAVVPLDLQETVLWLPKDKVDLSLWEFNTSDLWPAYQNLTHKFGEFAEDVWGSLSPDYVYPSNLPQLVEDYFEEARSHDYQRVGQVVTCTPKPGPFMPCEDLFDWWTLRCGIWIVFLLAMLGNGSVIFVLLFSRTKLDVPRFLVCNLACADFCMGIYLGFLAIVDASTLGHFKMHALQWQFSVGCQMAGFLGVFSSELSVYTLAVITLERNYAITHAMHLNKRLSLKHAIYIMICGWLFAVLTAALPLMGISNYKKFAVCLPFDIEASWSLAYVIFLMAINGVAFLILMGCYLKMYCAIRGSQAWNSNDSRIAKRMALLVFTDFICWAPIAFFSLTAAFGLQLINLEEAKVFTIFVLPLNSCANPFLYAILTKQFKKDCILICKAIEESRVTRGIGRCRHSSNFSNRQTPANTNSAVDRNSNNGQVACSCSRGSSDGAGQAQGSNPLPTDSTGSQQPPQQQQRRWLLSRMRFLLCFSSEDAEANSSNEYTYAIAEIQKNQQKHSRNLSVSSDNFSSSRSDSWRQKSIPLRLLDKGRQNSWTITRKSSQDSNLSSSRNDSSATTPSTSTWRVSRSSVSSDMSGSNAAGQRSTLANFRERAANPGTSSAAMQAVGSPKSTGGSPTFGGCCQPPPGQLTGGTVRFILPKLDGVETMSSYVPPTSARPRGKLRRQLAVSEEASCASPPPSLPAIRASAKQDDKCTCYSNAPDAGADMAIQAEEGKHGYQPMALRHLNSNKTLLLKDSFSSFQSGGNMVLLRESFVPRKLSTISSNSCSLNQEPWSACAVTQAADERFPGMIAPTSSRHPSPLQERCTSLINVSGEGGNFSDPRRTQSDATFQTKKLPSVFPTLSVWHETQLSDVASPPPLQLSQSECALHSVWEKSARLKDIVETNESAVGGYQGGEKDCLLTSQPQSKRTDTKHALHVRVGLNQEKSHYLGEDV